MTWELLIEYIIDKNFEEPLWIKPKFDPFLLEDKQI